MGRLGGVDDGHSIVVVGLQRTSRAIVLELIKIQANLRGRRCNANCVVYGETFGSSVVVECETVSGLAIGCGCGCAQTCCIVCIPTTPSSSTTPLTEAGRLTTSVTLDYHVRALHTQRYQYPARNESPSQVTPLSCSQNVPTPCWEWKEPGLRSRPFR